MIRTFLLAALALLSFASSAQAVLTTFNNNKSAFDAYASSRVQIGIEDFEESTLPPNMAVGFDAPLTQTTNNSPFADGILQPLTIQALTDANIATGNAPLTSGALSAFSSGFTLGSSSDPFVSDVVIPNSGGTALEIIFRASDQVSAVGFNPITNGSGATADIYVFDTNNISLGVFPSATARDNSIHFGVGIDAGAFIGRIVINPNSAAGGSGNIGADNIAFYSVPEPASYLMLSFVLGCVATRYGVKRLRADKSVA